MIRGKKIFAAAVFAIILASCGKAEPAQNTDAAAGPVEEAVSDKAEDISAETMTPTATPSQEATRHRLPIRSM